MIVISRPLAMAYSSLMGNAAGRRTAPRGYCLPATGLLELVGARLEGGLDVLVPVAGLVDLLHQLGVVLVEEGVQALLECQHLVDRQVIEVALLGSTFFSEATSGIDAPLPIDSTGAS